MKKSNKKHKKNEKKGGKQQATTANSGPHLLAQTPQGKPVISSNDKKTEVEKQPEAASSKKTSPLRHFVQGLVVVVLLIFFKTLWVEQTRFGKQVEQMTVNLLQLRLGDTASDRKRSAVVIDITALQQVDNGLIDKEKKLITPRDQLAQVVDSVAAAGPEAIGIDVYFELDAQGRISSKDEWFLDHCLDPKNTKGIPIFVGIYRSIVRGSQRWLDYPRFAEMGTAIVIPRGDDPSAPVSHLFTDLVVPVGGENVSVDSLSFALYKVARKDREQRRSLGSALHNRLPNLVEKEVLNEDQNTAITTHRFSIDFGSLETIIGTKIAAAEVTGKDFSSKIAIIGRGTAGETSDMFNVPGRGSPVPGVYVHAAALDTLLESPLFTLSQWGHILADTLTALIPLTVIFLLECLSHRINHTFAANTFLEKIFQRLPMLMAGIVVLIGYWLINRTGIYWTDFLLVAIALLLHEPANHLFQAIISAVTAAGSSVWRFAR